MKKITLVLFVSLFISSFAANAQKKMEKKAKKITTEITEVLKLNKKESKAVYQIQIDRLKESASIKKEYADDKIVRKQKLKKLGNKIFNQMKKTLGAERLKQWKKHKSKKKK